MGHLLPDRPVPSLDDYLKQGGGEGLERAHALGAEQVVAEIRSSGLRGRGGAGFPTGVKWRGTAAEAGPRYVVCNAAEGEPGTFKDRALMRANPYQLLEGVAIAAFAMDAAEAVIGIKASFRTEIARLDGAAAEMIAAGMLEGTELRLAEGPDDYLFGEETGLLEVIEGRDPLPRLYPPYVQGLASRPDGTSSPTVVNNVETLSNVPHILARGVDWFRSIGTERSPGTMVFTVCGDVRRETVVELPLGSPLSALIYEHGKGLEAGRRPRAVVSGVANRPLTAAELETPLAFEAMADIGSGLGAGGFLVYDDTTCIVEMAAALSGFLQTASCGQCPPCKLGTTTFASGFGDIVDGGGSLEELEELAAWTGRVTDANRCGLGTGQRHLAAGVLEAFTEEIVACMERRCPGHRGLLAPVILDHDEEAGRFVYLGAEDEPPRSPR